MEFFKVIAQWQEVRCPFSGSVGVSRYNDMAQCRQETGFDVVLDFPDGQGGFYLWEVEPVR